MHSENQNTVPGSVGAINWKTWQPDQRATLLFVCHGTSMLLIEKKRGLGAGKINAPGGRLEPGETPQQAAIRETEEEVCITPLDAKFAGELYFQFVDGLKLFCTVFKAAGYRGTPRETGEAKPMWVERDAIPYERMWRDDREWLPLLLNDTLFRGYFIFDDDHMVDYELIQS